MTRRGVNGEPMADVTEADRTKALLLVGTIDHHSDCLTHWDRGDCNCGIAAAQQEVAAAFAEEREKARAPFLRLASEFGSWPSARILSPHDAGDRIRRAALETE